MEFGFKDLDWRSLLTKRYKNYGLTEDDVMVILVASEVKKADALAPITSDTLTEYMSLSKDEIDNSLAKLMDRQFATYETKGNAAVLSFQLLFNRLFSDFKKDIVLASDSKTDKKVVEAYGYFEKTLNRSLSPLEIDKISGWLSEGATMGILQNATINIQATNQRVTFAKLEREILRLEKEKDISKEGYTVRNETNRDDRKLTDILAHDWLHDKKDE